MHVAAQSTRLAKVSAGVVAAVLLSTAAAVAAVAPAQDKSDATLHLEKLTIPPSDFWSPELKAVYARILANAREAASQPPQPDPHPARSAPKSEWDKFDQLLDASLAKYLTTVASRYPANLTEKHIAGVRASDISPKQGVAPGNKTRVLINLHGGGFVDFRGLGMGQLESIPVASTGRIRVITLDYRQSPYFQYPAATEDVEAVYRELLKTYKPQSIGIFGCSAGGILAAQSVAWFQAKGLPRPGAIGIFGFGLPSSPSNVRNGDSRMWGHGVPETRTAPALPESDALDWYMKGARESDSVAYPASSDEILKKFPSTLFLAGTREEQMSPAVAGHARLLKLGVDSSLYLMEGAWHCAHVVAPGTPEAHDASTYIGRWFNERLAT